MRRWILLVTIICSGCLKSSSPWAVIPEEDTSIVFPDFSARLPVVAGKQEQSYELDGVTLRAIVVAANDYIPPGTAGKYCWRTQEAQEYRVIRKGDIIFVSIGRDPSACHGEGLALDGGMKYAISKEGRILRRLDASYPDGPLPEPADAGVEEAHGDPIPTSLVGSTNLGGPGCLPAQWRRHGETLPVCPPSQPPPSSAVDGGSPPDGGTAPAPGR